MLAYSTIFLVCVIHLAAEVSAVAIKPPNHRVRVIRSPTDDESYDSKHEPDLDGDNLADAVVENVTPARNAKGAKRKSGPASRLKFMKDLEMKREEIIQARAKKGEKITIHEFEQIYREALSAIIFENEDEFLTEWKRAKRLPKLTWRSANGEAVEIDLEEQALNIYAKKFRERKKTERYTAKGEEELKILKTPVAQIEKDFLADLDAIKRDVIAEDLKAGKKLKTSDLKRLYYDALSRKIIRDKMKFVLQWARMRRLPKIVVTLKGNTRSCWRIDLEELMQVFDEATDEALKKFTKKTKSKNSKKKTKKGSKNVAK